MKGIARMTFVRKYAKLAVFARVDLHVILPPTTVSQKETVVLDQIFLNAMSTKNGMNAEANALRDIVVNQTRVIV